MGLDWKQLKAKVGPPLVVTGVTLGIFLFTLVIGGNELGKMDRERLGQTTQSSVQSSNRDNLSEVAFEATEGAVFFSIGTQLVGLPLAGTGTGTREDLQVIDLPAEPTFLVPTPGGVSIFLGFSGISEIYVYSAQDFSLQARIPIDLENPEAMSFSPTGEQAFIFSDQGRRVTEYAHSRLTLTQLGTKDLTQGEARFISNRRGTRFFRAETQGMRIHLAQQLVDAEFWETQIFLPVFDPGFTEIWGLGQDSTVRVIDERTGREIRRFQQPVASLPGVVTNRISYLSLEGTQIFQYSPRRSSEPRIISLPEPVRFLTRGLGQSLLALSTQGTMYEITQEGRVEEHGIDLGGLTDRLGLDLVTTAIVRQDGSFACF